MQENVTPKFTKMLIAAMQVLHIGAAWHLSTDVGTVIDDAARKIISDLLAKARHEGR